MSHLIVFLICGVLYVRMCHSVDHNLLVSRGMSLGKARGEASNPVPPLGEYPQGHQLHDCNGMPLIDPRLTGMPRPFATT